jgi:Rod binding domain-containing protein
MGSEEDRTVSWTGLTTLNSATGSSTGQTTPQPRLVKAAHEFEAQMMKELLKPLTSGSGEDGEEDGESSGGALTEYAGEAMARAISEAGGFGISNRIVSDLTKAGNSQI